MAKKLLFSLLTCTIVLGFSFFSPLEGSNIPKSIISNSDFCDAPPPDSFRVTSINSEAVSFTWIPAWTGASHTITISLMNENGGWDYIATDNNVPGDTYSFSSPSAGSYKATIATNCTTGETSTRNSPAYFKILELSTAGRIPFNPSFVNLCDPINILEWEWYGFSVRNKNNQNFNLFELDDNGIVRRVFNNSIVATDELGLFPIAGQTIPTGTAFLIQDFSLDDPIVGKMTISLESPMATRICMDQSLIKWNSDYVLTILKSQTVKITPPGSGSGQGLMNGPSKNDFRVQSVFFNTLTIWPSISNFETPDLTLIEIFDLSGTLKFSDLILSTESSQILQTESLTNGIYFLKINTGQQTQVFKIMKIAQ